VKGDSGRVGGTETGGAALPDEQADAMNARPSIPELDRIRRDIGARLRIEHAVTEPAPENLIALLKELATRVRDAKREKLFAEVDAQVAELLRAAGRQPQDAYRPAGESADETVHTVRSPEATLAKSAECGTLGVAQRCDPCRGR
jgi:hypothetical protein